MLAWILAAPASAFFGNLDFDGDGYSLLVDCDDGNAAIYPGATEVVGDNVDQDCSGNELCYRDLDGDRFGSAVVVTSADVDCLDLTEASNSLDCNDLAPTSFPGAVELVADGLDQDCDGGDSCWIDLDLDGSGGSAVVPSLDLDCADAGEAARVEDCNDANALVHPGAAEVVADGLDEDCDFAELCYADLDHDGYGSTLLVVSLNDLDCVDVGEATQPTDCDDASATVSPGAAEVTADAVDQDCDGGDLCWADDDGDGSGGSGVVASGDLDCADPGEAAGAGDCDDADPGVYPGAVEVVADGRDDDCDGGDTCWADADGDGASGGVVVSSDDLDCDDPGEVGAADPADCDDLDPTRHPDAPELCDGLDDDCDGAGDLPNCDPDDIDQDGLRDADEEAVCAEAGADPAGCPLDPDVDGDGVVDGVEVEDLDAPIDTDGDGVIDMLDPDDDADGATSRRENGILCGGDLVAALDPGGYWTFECYGNVYDFGSNDLAAYPDTDADGVPDLRDADDDGDGVLSVDEGPGDVDCDGVENAVDPVDSDGPCAYVPPTGSDPDPDPTEGPTGSDPLPDAPDAEGPAKDVGCGCSSGPVRPGLALGLALGLARRRSRQRPSADARIAVS